MFILIAALGNNSQSNTNPSPSVQDKSATEDPKSDKEILTEKIADLISAGKAFNAQSFVAGDIPKGVYAFMPVADGGQYYSEEDVNGNIIDNENFDSFGYVYVQGIGNVQTDGVLISIDAITGLGVENTKELYERLKETSNYNDSGMYKVGFDIPAGTYTVESYGESYVAVTDGPVGNSEIVNNDNFKGKRSFAVNTGQYLSISRGRILLP